MSSRKRSRKSKLVPRECAVDNEDVELQCPSFKICKQQAPEPTHQNAPGPSHQTIAVISEGPDRILKQNQNSTIATETVQANSAPIQFRINVEVEKCDEYAIQVIPVDTEHTLETTESTNNCASQNLELINNKARNRKPSKTTNELKSLETSSKTNSRHKNIPVVLTNANILQAAQKIIDKAPTLAERILDIALRNMIGHPTKGNQYQGIHDNKIQQVLDDWRTWQFRSFHRDSPLFYKCYICELSWWHLSEFREHIAQHSDLNIDLESYERHETNVVAYSIVKPKLREIFTEGNCSKCGEDYNTHKMGSQSTERFYSYKGCSKQFYTCTGLRAHSGPCKQCKKNSKRFKCEVCKLDFFETEEMKDDHLRLCHSVRSDDPITSLYKTCDLCDARYMTFSLHVCNQRESYIQCSRCFWNFPNEFIVSLHMGRSTELYECEVCSKLLLWSCQKYEHMLTHTDKYITAKKCVKCEDFEVFVDNDSALEHKHVYHPGKDTKRQFSFAKIIIPKSCIEPDEEESEWKYTTNKESEIPSESVPVSERIIIKEEPESFPQFVIKDEPIDVYENPVDYNILAEANAVYTNTDTNHIITDVTIKQEYPESEEEEYEDDIIKLNIDISEHLMMAKQEPPDVLDEYIEASELNQESNDNSQESFDYDDSQDSSTDNLSSIKIKLNPDSGDLTEKVFKPEVIMLGKMKKMYTCPRCGFTARHRTYKEHINNGCKPYSEPKQFGCTKCDIVFNTMKKYLGHLVMHGYKRLYCPECSQLFDSYSKLTPHVHSHIRQGFVKVKLITLESKQKPEYQCKKCAEVVNMGDFFKHWERHIIVGMKTLVIPRTINNMAPQPTTSDLDVGEIKEDVVVDLIHRLSLRAKQCNFCHRVFNRYNECKRHLIEHLLTDAYAHKQEYQELRCQICDSGFHTAERYKQHMRDHANLPVYKCELCDRTFSDSSNFTKHKKVHNLKVFVCDLCGKKFQSKLSLAKHFEMHKTSKPIMCQPCNKIFHFDSAYRKHVRYFHDRIQLGYKCMMCNQRFESLKLKWNHMWEVHKERKIKADCPICLKSFRKYSDVRLHAREEHHTEVSVYNMKNQSETRKMIIQKFMKKQNNFKLRPKETLIVYE